MRKKYEVGVSTDGSYIYVRHLRAKISLDLAMRFTADFVALGQEHGIRRCLLDMRGTSSITGVAGKYQFAYEKADTVGLTRDWRMAVLKDPKDTSFDFLETVMQNTSRSLKVFEDEAVAMEWLTDKQRV